MAITRAQAKKQRELTEAAERAAIAKQANPAVSIAKPQAGKNIFQRSWDWLKGSVNGLIAKAKSFRKPAEPVQTHNVKSWADTIYDAPGQARDALYNGGNKALTFAKQMMPWGKAPKATETTSPKSSNEVEVGTQDNARPGLLRMQLRNGKIK